MQHIKDDDARAAVQDMDQDQHTEGKTEHKLVMSDQYGQATMSATLHEDGRIEAQTESTAAEEGSCSALAASVTAASPSEEGPVLAEIQNATSPAQAAPPAEAASGSSCPAEMAASEGSQEAGSGSGAEVAPDIGAIATAMQQKSQEQSAEQSTVGLAAAAPDADMDARSAPGDDLAASTAAEEPEDNIEDLTGDLPEPDGERVLNTLSGLAPSKCCCALSLCCLRSGRPPSVQASLLSMRLCICSSGAQRCYRSYLSISGIVKL